ncbi:MAG: tetratricopeptide repeat protein [Bacteroidales bacterium]|nr:tetratricopeptide repeat protein [Lentimicrobiaceae bacterium]MDD5693859.1 tetratricopeptide repeat protein [Bacteroidales bacterium]
MNNLRVFIVGLLSILSGTVTAGINEDLVAQSNKDYSAGLYSNAIEGYTKVLQSGYASVELYYNLGNAYFKTDDLPSAILFYEKAKKLKPNDPDILFNLNVANSRIKDKIEAVPVLFYKRWWSHLVNAFSPDGWTRFHMISFLAFLVAVVFYFISKKVFIRKIAFWTGALMLTGSLITFGIALQQDRTYQEVKEAIVFDPSLTVKSSPSENSVDLFVVHEGTKVTITDKLGEWYEIRIANGSAGWIPGTSLKSI